MTIQDILSGKGTVIYHVTPANTVYEAIEKMAEHNIGALVVLDGDRLCGILSERDYRNKIILKGRASRETKVSEIMTDSVICVGPQHSVDYCLNIMTQKKIRHLPVLDDSQKLVGVVSIGDLVKATIEQKNLEIEDLKGYIFGGYPG
ncbi:MAG: CBS domain-containing protein [Bacteroidetes bacterium]|nr:CBS domain-containing protein [Bacteroidota bacterium]MCH8525432.1 CBS domain-containing protein [Balneolales bacterium]